MDSQWLRYFRLIVTEGGDSENVLDLSDFRVRFHISQRVVGKPTTAEIFIYNVSQDTINAIRTPTNQFLSSSRPKVVIEAGYQSDHAMIFQGDLWWKSTGRESETDTFLRLIAATGDRVQNFSVVSASIPKGATQSQVFETVAKSMEKEGVSGPQTMPAMQEGRLPRGKVIYQPSAQAMNGLADTNDFSWGYGTNGLITVPKKPTFDGNTPVIVLTAATGLVGRPKLTVEGVTLQCLLNPRIDVGTLIQIDNRSIQRDAYDTAVGASIEKNRSTTNDFVGADGIYSVISREFSGDTRGTEWYANLVAVAVYGSKPVSPTIASTFPNM